MTPAQTPDEEADAEDYAVDIEDIANQQIVSLIKSEFAGHALADLVAEILRVEGCTTKVSASGPDQGVDILAAGGTLRLPRDIALRGDQSIDEVLFERDLMVGVLHSIGGHAASGPPRPRAASAA